VSARTRLWLFILAAAAAGGALTWLAFGFGVQEKPVPDLSEGVELVQPRDRTAK
jgi:hypothetical protein